MKLYIGLLIAAAGTMLFAACGPGNKPKQADSTAATTDTAPKAAASSANVKPGATLVPGEYLVTFSQAYRAQLLEQTAKLAGRDEKAFTSLLQPMFAEEFGPLLQPGETIELPSPFGFLLKGSEATAKGLRANKLVLDVEQNVIISVDLGTATPLDNAPLAQLLPWGVSTVVNTSQGGPFKKAWIVDTGVQPGHQDLNIGETKNMLSSEETDADLNGHGTHVAGIIGAVNNGIGVVGVAAGAPIHSVKVFKNTSPNPSTNMGKWYIPGLEYVYGKASSGDVLNLSFSGEDESTRETELVKAIAAKGVKVVIAAGNDAKNVSAGSGIYPANINGANIYTVAGYDRLNTWVPSSNFGASVDYAAPGKDIESLSPANNTPVKRTGTSMAAPHIAGLYLRTTTLSSRGNVKGPDNRNYNMAKQ